MNENISTVADSNVIKWILNLVVEAAKREGKTTEEYINDILKEKGE